MTILLHAAAVIILIGLGYSLGWLRELRDEGRLHTWPLCQIESEHATTLLPDYICAMYGGVFVRLPETGDLDNVDMHHRSLRTAVKRGRVDQFLALALEDGEITASEAADILALHAKHIAARHEEVNALIELHKADR